MMNILRSLTILFVSILLVLMPIFANGSNEIKTPDTRVPIIRTNDEHDEWAKNQVKYIEALGLPDGFGLTMTFEECRSLLHKDIDTIQERVKTVADVMLYLLVSNISGGHNENMTYDFVGKNCILNCELCCCASWASTSAWLLQDDYEYVGIFRILSGNHNGANYGEHVFNWVYENGKYYVFDMNDACAYEGYDHFAEFRKKFTVWDDINDFVDACPAGFDAYGEWPFDMLLMYVSPGVSWPECDNGGREEKSDTDWYQKIYPLMAQNYISVLYESPNRTISIRFEDMDWFNNCNPNWRKDAKNARKMPTQVNKHTFVVMKDYSDSEDYLAYVSKIKDMIIEDATSYFQREYEFECPYCGNTEIESSDKRHFCTSCGKSVSHEAVNAYLSGKYKGRIDGLGDIILGIKGWTDTDGHSMILIGDKCINGGLGNYDSLVMSSPFDSNWIHYKKMNNDGIVCDVEWDGITYNDVVFSRLN